jgi:hypothetical protein
VHFRRLLKAEMGVFLPLVALRPLEKAPLSAAHRLAALRLLRDCAACPGLLVDLFANYDCDLEAANLFERMLLALTQVAQDYGADDGGGGTRGLKEMMGSMGAMGAAAVAKGSAGQGAGALDAGGAAAEALGCLLEAMRSFERLVLQPPDHDGQREGALDGAAAVVGGPLLSSPNTPSKLTRKMTLEQGIAAFNKSPLKGVALLQACGAVGPAASDVARFLHATPGLDKHLIGEVLGHHEDEQVAVMHAYVELLAFHATPFDQALRLFLAGFRLPGEAQKIDRLMEKFAARFCEDHPGRFKSVDTAYVPMMGKRCGLAPVSDKLWWDDQRECVKAVGKNCLHVIYSGVY